MPGLPGGLAGTGVSEQRTLSIGLVGADGSKSSVSVSLPGIELAGGAQLSELESAIGAFSNAGVFRATLGTDYKISVPTAQVETDFYDMGRALQVVLQDSNFNTIAVAIPAPKLSLFPDRRVLAQRDGTASIGTPARVIDDLFSALEDAINGSTDPAGGYAVVRTALTTRKSNRWVAPSVPELTES